MDQVKQMVDAGARIPTAIKEALRAKGMTVRAFAEKYELPLTATRSALYGYMKPSQSLLAALVAELDGTADAWAELLWLAGKPTAALPADPAAKLAANQ